MRQTSPLVKKVIKRVAACTGAVVLVAGLVWGGSRLIGKRNPSQKPVDEETKIVYIINNNECNCNDNNCNNNTNNNQNSQKPDTSKPDDGKQDNNPSTPDTKPDPVKPSDSDKDIDIEPQPTPSTGETTGPSEDTTPTTPDIPTPTPPDDTPVTEPTTDPVTDETWGVGIGHQKTPNINPLDGVGEARDGGQGLEP